jgi:hypothetical protein
MNGLIATRTGETMQDGQVVPEEDVVRQGETGVSFQTREATTIYQGSRPRRGRTAGGDACATEPGQVFQVREAVTVIVPPPHWAQLTEQEEMDHVSQPGPDADSGKTGSL